MTNPIESSSFTMSDELVVLLNRIKALRGDPVDWLRKYTILSKYITQLSLTYRVICRGEWQSTSLHTPSILVYNITSRHFEALVVHDDKVEARDPHWFCSTTPHTAIANEVYNSPETESSSI